MKPNALAGLRRPLQLVAILALALGLVSCVAGSDGPLSPVLFFAAVAAWFGSWAVGAPPPREREGMLDDTLRAARRKVFETPREQEERRTRPWYRRDE